MMLESIEKLRELACDINGSEIVDHMQLYPSCVFDGAWLDSWHCEFDRVLEALEREIAEKYIELPVDADGVPIHVGDDLKFVNGELLVCEGVDAHGAVVWREEQFEFIQGESLRHVEHDSLEHLLADVSKGAIRYPRERVTGYLEDNNSIGEAVMLDIRDRLRDLIKEGEAV